MSTSSTSFIDTITDRLLTRSASTPAGREKSKNGVSKMICASAVHSCPWLSLANPPIASRMRNCFHALSLNAPKNWVTISPRNPRQRDSSH